MPISRQKRARERRLTSKGVQVLETALAIGFALLVQAAESAALAMAFAPAPS